MQAPLSDAYTQEKRWEASRLAMRGAHWDIFSPWVNDPKDILAFLDHHFNLATRGGENQDEPIQHALCALAYASSPTAIEILKKFDPTKPSFAQGVCHIYQDKKRIHLRRAASFFLPLIGDRWFNAAEPIMEPDQMKKLCSDWASAVDNIGPTLDVQKATLAVLLDMINSHWRPHIVMEKRKLLEYITSVPDYSQPLKRCLDNPELTDAISQVGYPAMFFWLEILWLKYSELIPVVREQLEAITKEIAQGTRRTDLDMYMSVMDSKLANAENVLAKFDPQSVDPFVLTLRAKMYNLQPARAALFALKEANAASA